MRICMCDLVCTELTDGTVETIDGSSGHIRISDTQLLITLATIDDSGLYVCNASNNIGHDTSTADLSVLGKIILTSQYSLISAGLNSWVSKPCQPYLIQHSCPRHVLY